MADMFENWASPAIAAILAGSALWGVFLAPLLVYQVRAYGGLSIRRAIGLAAVAIYGVALVAYTLLPTPGTQSWCERDHGGTWELEAFHSVGEIRRVVAAEGRLGALTTFTVLQVFLNVLLFVPWGVLARRYFHMPWIVAILSGAFASLLIESTQFAGGWTLIGCQYRVADIDDLIANTVGTIIGVIIAPLLLFWMPPASELARGRLRPRQVTGLRRAAAVLIDLAILVLVALVAFQVIIRVLPVSGPDAAAASRHALAFVVGGVAVMLPSLAGAGGSWGERLLWLVPVARVGSRMNRGRAVARAVLGYGFLTAILAIGAWAESRGAGVQEYVVVAGYGYAGLLLLWSAVDVRGGLPDALAGSTTVDARGEAAVERI